MGTLTEDSLSNGGAIYVKMGPIEDTQVINSTFTNCSANYGGAIYNVNAKGCNFSFCQANDYGGAMYYGTAIGCIFDNNHVSGNDGGAIFWGNAINCTFKRNYAKYGGAVYNVNVNGCIFIENNATCGGALYGSKLKVIECRFISNNATDDGGAVYNGGIIDKCIFINNSAQRNGGAVYSDGGGVINSSFEDNSAGGNGGAVYKGDIILCTFENNTAVDGQDYSGSVIKNLTISPSEFEVNYPSQVSMPIKVGYKDYTIDGIDVAIELKKNGNVIGNYNCLSGQNWTVNLDVGAYGVKYTATTHDLVEEFCFLKVSGVKTKINASDMEDVFYKQDNYLVATLLSENDVPLAGYNVTVTTFGRDENITTDENGQIRVPLKDLECKMHYFSFTFSGKEQYEPSSNYVNVYVRMMNVMVYAEDFWDLKYGQQANITATLKDENDRPMAGYNLSIIINGQTTTLVTDDNGSITMKIPKVPVGFDQYRVKFDGTESIVNCFRDFQLSISPMETKIVTSDVKIDYTHCKVIAKLLDDYNQPVSDGKVNLAIGNLNLCNYTNENGETVFDVSDLDEGEYEAKFSFDGDSNYIGSDEKTVNVEIFKLKSIINVENISVGYGQSGLVVISLTDENGNPLVNEDLKIQSLFTSTFKTDENGQVILNISNDLSTGEYNNRIIFEETNNYQASESSFKVTVEKIMTSIYAAEVVGNFSEDKCLSVTLKDQFGNYLENATIAVNVAGKTLLNVTDKNGEAKFSLDLDSNSYVASIEFGGNITHAGSSTSANILVNKDASKISSGPVTTVFNQGKYLVVSLVDGNGKAIADANVIVDLNGKINNLITDFNGQAKLLIYNLIPKDYVASIMFDGDSNHLKSSTSVKVIVKKATPKMTAKAKTFKKSVKTKKYKITLKDNKGKAIKKAKVTLKIKGKKTVSVKTNAKGKATFKIKKLTKKGTYKATVTFKANKYYNKVAKKVKIKVK